MTIQISVLLWTVITFCILMFFLNKFLFKPLLAFMDAREQKIASARERREKAALALETAEREAEQRRRAAEKQARDAAAAAILDAKRLAAKQTAEAENRYALLLEQRRSEMETEKRELQQNLDAGMDDLVTAFVQKLVS
ncbi:MAG: ATP synthase F0 subunit B [bacterium]|nr:ATP synthase F0 subunit B [bacterium]